MNKRECTLCRENKGVKYFTNCHGNKAYVAQQTWNRKMTRLLAADGVIPVHPAPNYSLKALEAWTVGQSVTKTLDKGEGVPNTWWRETYALLQREPKSMRGFSFMPKGEVV